MYNDHVSTGRSKWTYSYSGKELLPYAAKLLKKYDTKEAEARKAMAAFMLDRTKSNRDHEVKKTEEDIVSYGTLHEQCAVFAHEFERNPDKVYELGIGDVTFFEIVSNTEPGVLR